MAEEYIVLPSGLQITSTDPVDTRLVLTKEEMRALKKPTMPEAYICVCKDDGKLYIYDKTITELDPELGRFVLVEDRLNLMSGKIKYELDKAVADNIESGSESTKTAITNVVNDTIQQVKIDGQIIK